MGSTVVTLTVTDSKGASSSCQATVTVERMALLDVCLEGRDIAAEDCGTPPVNPAGKTRGNSCIAHSANSFVESLGSCYTPEEKDEIHSCIVSYFASGGKSKHFGEE